MDLSNTQLRHAAILGRALKLRKKDFKIPDPLDPPAMWLTYFQENYRRPRAVEWNDQYRLSAAEKRDLGPSIATFQLGEEGEGLHLRRCARRYAAKTRDFDYVRACALFIGEEQRHAAELARFMRREGIAHKQQHWSDEIFKRLRHISGLDTAICVLLTAEMIALVYYRALGRSTRSATLSGLCRLFLREEHAHVLFQAGTLGRLRRQRPGWLIQMKLAAQFWLYLLAVIAVWADHRRVFRRAGFSCKRYWRACWSVYATVMPLMKARRL